MKKEIVLYKYIQNNKIFYGILCNIISKCDIESFAELCKIIIENKDQNYTFKLLNLNEKEKIIINDIIIPYINYLTTSLSIYDIDFKEIDTIVNYNESVFFDLSSDNKDIINRLKNFKYIEKIWYSPENNELMISGTNSLYGVKNDNLFYDYINNDILDLSLNSDQYFKVKKLDEPSVVMVRKR